MQPTAINCIVPSRLTTGEPFNVKVRLLGDIRPIPVRAQWNTPKPALRSPFNLNMERQIQFHDDVLPEWSGSLKLLNATNLDGPATLAFDGRDQGVFKNDTRPIRSFPGFRFQKAGLHFIRLIEPVSGLEAWSNPVMVTDQPPALRLYWGDPHWQTFFSDGIRCPEELYAFARDQAFLDFGAITDHMEAVTDAQWRYFQEVTNAFNRPGAFATLIGQEWTNHNRNVGAPGHRNIYYRGDGGPAVRSNAPDCDTLAKLWQKLAALDETEVLAIPHHSANVQMGTDWSQGWNPKYEKAVEIHSVWGSSECHADDGNPLPILNNGGEQRGRHVIDALKMGFRMGLVGGGDIHDGRPGLPLHNHSYLKRAGSFNSSRPCGYTAVRAPELTRAAVFDAMRDRRTYATTQSRIYLDVAHTGPNGKSGLEITGASEEGIQEAAVIVNGSLHQRLAPDDDPRIVKAGLELSLAPDDFCYMRLTTNQGNLAWSSPIWGDGA